MKQYWNVQMEMYKYYIVTKLYLLPNKPVNNENILGKFEK